MKKISKSSAILHEWWQQRMKHDIARLEEKYIPLSASYKREDTHKAVDAYYDAIEGAGEKPYWKERRWLRSHWNGCLFALVGCAIMVVGLGYPRLSVTSLLTSFYGILMIILGMILDIWRRE